MLYNELKKRNLPPLKSREEMKEIIQRDLFGYMPTVDYTLSASEPKIIEGRYNEGNSNLSKVDITITIDGKSHTFPICRLFHLDGKKRPLIIVNNFHRMTESIYFPIEELSEYDVDYIQVCYKDITSDDGDFSTGIAPLLLPNGQDTDTTCGKIGLWAWTASRILDYALTLDNVDKDNVMIAGHSRLGKTALFTAMCDERFKYAFSNAAGCAGDSLYRGNSGFLRGEDRFLTGELISDIYSAFPYWFCKNYSRFVKTNIPDTFDQHYLIASICPRYVIIGSCDLDPWADPKSQQLCALAGAKAWENANLSGLVGANSEFLQPPSNALDGHVGYFIIQSLHFLSRHSWHNALAFIEKHRNEK